MQNTALLTALLMGLVGGPHCVAMCGSACAAMGRASEARSSAALFRFQAGRLLGYSSLGAMAAASMQGFAWLSTYSAAIRPVWSLFHVGVMVLGVLLLVTARQPVWLELGARRIWRRVTVWTVGFQSAAPALLGACWALMPCGLLYSAVLLAAVSGAAFDGALTMAAFALGSGFSMLLGPWLLLQLGVPRYGDWGVRVAGLLLLSSSAWALWRGLTQGTAPWCLPQ